MGVVDPAFWRGRRVLVTGNTGFKGAWMTLWLLELGAAVTGLALPPPTNPSLYELAGLADELPQDSIDIRNADAVRDAVAARRPEVVLHMAAQSLVRQSFREPRETFEVNVLGTVNVLDAIRTTGADVRVVVNVTSDKCYENREWEWGYRENEPMGGHDPYSSSKGCSELVTSAFRASFFSDPDGPRVASARAGNVIGGGDWSHDRLIPDIMRGVMEATTVEIRHPGAVRPWQHVLNALSGYLALAQAAWEDAQCAAAFNFGPADEDSRPVQWIVDRIAERWPDRIDWRVGTGPNPHEAKSLKLDSSRAYAQLGWRPTLNLSEALDTIVDWYLALRDGGDARHVTSAQIVSFADAAPEAITPAPGGNS